MRQDFKRLIGFVKPSRQRRRGDVNSQRDSMGKLIRNDSSHLRTNKLREVPEFLRLQVNLRDGSQEAFRGFLWKNWFSVSASYQRIGGSMSKRCSVGEQKDAGLVL